MESKFLHLMFSKAVSVDSMILPFYDFQVDNIDWKIEDKSTLKQASNLTFNNEICEQ